MIITHDDELQGMKEIGRIVANAVKLMSKSMETGMTTAELDEVGRAYLDQNDAISAPEAVYNFPGATCISVNEEVAHGIPGPRMIRAGDLVNIDVSASKHGFYADTGASFLVGPKRREIDQLCRDGRKALQIGIDQVGAGKPLAGIGNAIGTFAEKKGLTLIRNLASHGVGYGLHEEPSEIATWPTRSDRRRMQEGQVFTIEPFLSKGALWADEGEDGWTLYGQPPALCVQYEHTLVVTKRGALVVTQPD